MNLHEDSLWLGAFLKERVDDIVPVYPCVAATGAPSTFCIYRRAGYSGDDNKDGIGSDSEILTVVLTVASPTYGEALDKAQQIKESLNLHRVRWNGKIIYRIKLINASEEWNADRYLQTLTFDFVIG